MNNYRKAVLKTAKIHSEDQLLWVALGLCVASGEFANFIKKEEFHNQSLEKDKQNVLKKIGELRWYLELAAHNLGVSMEEIEQKNIEVLKIRHPEAFEEETLKIETELTEPECD